jgi:hypothetical protein
MARTVKRGANPHAPTVKLHNQNLTPEGDGAYQSLTDRVKHLPSDSSIINAINELKTRLNGQIYSAKDFGRLELVPFGLMDINIDIQRILENEHIANNILARFDPRVMQTVSVVYIKSTGRYSAWDGQQSSAAMALLKHFGLLADDVLIPCKVTDDDLYVPGSTLAGEAVGNLGFRLINGSGKKTPDVFYVFRSQVNGKRRYDSTLQEDIQSEEIQQIFEANTMFPAPAVDAQGQKATPGMITHISGCRKIAGHDTENFDTTKEDLNWALNWHNTYFSQEKGVDGGFILAFGRLHAEARDQDIKLTAKLEKELFEMIRDLYGSPRGFHYNCQERLGDWQVANGIKKGWRDSCLTPFLVLDYINWGGTQRIPAVTDMGLYEGIE